MDAKTHWDKVYSTKRGEEVSWYQANPACSLRLLEQVPVGPAT
jgi:hypothetical protein